jgi:hypothetical protein
MKAPDPDELRQRDRFVRSALRDSFEALQCAPLEAALETRHRRAAPLRRALEDRSLTLVRDPQGLLRWQIGAALTPGAGSQALAGVQARRAGLRRAPLAAPPVLSQVFFDRLEPSKIGQWLKLADQRLTRPAWNERGQLWGLRRMTGAGKLVPFGADELHKLAGRKVLLFVHGTFSSSDVLLKELATAPGGPAMLSAALTHYDFVLCFDHPTLGQSPMLNAFDLASRLALGVPASLDLVAHSRGGLVVRWFCEGFRQSALTCRAVLVGAPLAGTSLAAPARAKAVMDFLANVGDAVGSFTALGGGVILAFASTLAGLFARVTGALSTPLADAIVALVPGLAAQSREGGNAELRALRVNTGAFDFTGLASPVRYAVVRSNFAPAEGAGVWNFLKSFVTRPGASLMDAAADLVFQDDNDLVVDTSSMDETGELPGPPIARAVITSAHDFGTSRTVHHCNYFEQRATVAAIRTTFGF